MSEINEIDDGLVECPGCGALVPDIEGPTHPYIGANAGCWGMYGEVLAREYSETSFRNLHRLVVDTYAVQHPGKKDRRAAQSVNVHLVGLYLLLEKNLSTANVTRAMSRLTQRTAEEFEWLEPPASLGDIKVTHVWMAETPNEHGQGVEAWARSAWQAWRPHHAKIADLATSVIEGL